MAGRELRLVQGALLFALLVTISVPSPSPVQAQQPDEEDQIIDSIRSRTEIGASDQRRINRWIQDELNGGEKFDALRKRFRDQYTNGKNTEVFKTQFALQAADVAVNTFADTGIGDELAHGLAQVLADLNRVETIPGLLVGLKSHSGPARLLCARALSELRLSIATNDTQLKQVVAGLTQAGVTEEQPAVLGRIYEALGYPTKVQVVADSYLQIFDSRLQARRKMAVVDGAEYYALDYFDQQAVLDALTNDQKNKLVKNKLVSQLAVFLRLDAQRYAFDKLEFREMDWIERCLFLEESILEAFVKQPGEIRNELDAGGWPNRQKVLAAAYKWIGNPITKVAGTLNAAPWNVPVGAP